MADFEKNSENFVNFFSTFLAEYYALRAVKLRFLEARAPSSKLV